MTVRGVGTHLIECPRVSRLLERHAEVFLDQVYTRAEQLFCRDRATRPGHLAAIWAGKEAVFRSLGVPWRRGFAWTDIELASETELLGEATLTGGAADLARERGVKKVLVATAHTRSYATATAVAEG